MFDQASTSGISLLEMIAKRQWVEVWLKVLKDVRSACLVSMLEDGFHSDLLPVSASPELDLHSAHVAFCFLLLRFILRRWKTGRPYFDVM
jgi:hypothetical protein